MTAPDVKIRRALISVSDKTGLIDLGKSLAQAGVEIVSTGGTASALKAHGLNVVDVAELTGFPEMMDGRLKTLHPKVHGGLLAIRGKPSHEAAAKVHGIAAIDLLVVNLYPFEATVAAGADFAHAIENIDIGGPAMIRAAAKNHAGVAVVVEPADYGPLLDEMARTGGATRLQFRRQLAAKAYARTGAYDAAIANWFANALNDPAPIWRAFGGRLEQALRYGENPHQDAAFYVSSRSRPGIATARQLQGKELSYNNLNDTDAAFELVAEFDPGASAACAIIKHANPCGVGLGASVSQAYARALKADPVSAFGGVVALNRPIDAEAARAIVEIFTEVVIAPGASDEAIAIFAGKKNLRLLMAGGVPDPEAPGLTVRSVAGGFLVQSRDTGRAEASAWRVVTKRAPTPLETADLLFAAKVVKHVKSNAIVYAHGGATVGIGAGQMSRIDAARIAGLKAAEVAQAAGMSVSPTKGSVAASDAFFPFPDGLETIAKAGASAIIQPGGSMKDADVIKAADAHGLAMVFTGLRHFRH